jgi:alpha-glucosidase
MKIKLIFLTLFFSLVLQNAFCAKPSLQDVASPDGNLHFRLSAENGKPVFSVIMNGKAAIDPSPIVMTLDGVSITDRVRTGKVTKMAVNESYPLKGLHTTAHNNYNEASVPFTASTGLKYTLEIRVFNDAAAFRFIIPGDENTVRYPDEATVFNIPSESTLWYHDLYMHYEGVHAMKLIDTVPAGQWAAPPLTIRLPGNAGYASITEADLINYAGMALQSNGRNGFTLQLGHRHPASYPYILRYKEENAQRLSKIAGVKGTITTPWRVVIAGRDLNTLVNSDVVYSLCPAPDKKYFPEGSETSWVKPGRAVWKYLDGGGDGTLTVMKRFSKEAADLGFEYNILEGFWSRWPDDSIKALVDYSKNLGVRIIVWRHSNTLHDPIARKELFKKCHELGIAGLKIDFFDHEAKETADLYPAILQEAAEEKLVCIFHGANKPTGLWRTWPNAMIYEAVKGMEASKLLDRATHETTIPFTRMIAGPADYSVCHFGTRRQNTTWVHQAATAAIYAAPVITYASTPAHILENPCVEMIRSIPAVWDETMVLPPSEIGEIAIYAQRKGNTWFLSVINGLEPKNIKIPLSFIGEGSYKTFILNDNPANPADAIISEGKATKGDVFDISLGKGGGFMARFTRVD